jgi:hypothetical protein
VAGNRLDQVATTPGLQQKAWSFSVSSQGTGMDAKGDSDATCCHTRKGVKAIFVRVKMNIYKGWRLPLVLAVGLVLGLLPLSSVWAGRPRRPCS